MKTLEELLKENEKLQSEIQSLRIKNEQLSSTVAWYEQQARIARIQKFQKTSESGAPYQLSLFDEIEVIQEAAKELEKTEEKEETVTIKEHTRKKKTKRDYGKMLVRVIHHDIKDKTNKIEVEPLIKEEIIYIPERTILRRHIIHQYIDKKLSTDEHTVFVSGKNYHKLIDKSMASPSLVASLIYKKFILGQPLYRIEADFNRKNIPITRQDMSNWLIYCVENYLEPISKLMETDFKSVDIGYGDETTVNCLEEKDRDKSYMWVTRSSPTGEKQIVLYYYNASREYDFAKQIYEGFQGYLHCDDYGAYKNLEGVKRVLCWAHARRKVYEAVESYQIDSKYRKSHSKQEKAELLRANPAYAKTLELFTLIEELFVSEQKIQKEYQGQYDSIKEKRIEQETSILKNIRKYLDENMNTFLPKSKSNMAIQYIDHCWQGLQTYLEDGRLELTNNLGERTVKPFVMGRKAWLFANTERGAKGSAILYSITQTAIANHLKPEEYITYVLDKIKDDKDILKDEKKLRKLLPYSKSLPEKLKK